MRLQRNALKGISSVLHGEKIAKIVARLEAIQRQHLSPSLYHVKTSLFTVIQAENEVFTGGKRFGGRARWSEQECP
jgi:hypothetical protein